MIRTRKVKSVREVNFLFCLNFVEVIVVFLSRLSCLCPFSVISSKNLIPSHFCIAEKNYTRVCALSCGSPFDSNRCNDTVSTCIVPPGVWFRLPSFSLFLCAIGIVVCKCLKKQSKCLCYLIRCNIRPEIFSNYAMWMNYCRLADRCKSSFMWMDRLRIQAKILSSIEVLSSFSAPLYLLFSLDCHGCLRANMLFRLRTACSFNFSLPFVSSSYCCISNLLHLRWSVI